MVELGSTETASIDSLFLQKETFFGPILISLHMYNFPPHESEKQLQTISGPVGLPIHLNPSKIHTLHPYVAIKIASLGKSSVFEIVSIKFFISHKIAATYVPISGKVTTYIGANPTIFKFRATTTALYLVG
jgi:hypothetical protein